MLLIRLNHSNKLHGYWLMCKDFTILMHCLGSILPFYLVQLTISMITFLWFEMKNHHISHESDFTIYFTEGFVNFLWTKSSFMSSFVCLCLLPQFYWNIIESIMFGWQENDVARGKGSRNEVLLPIISPLKKYGEASYNWVQLKLVNACKSSALAQRRHWDMIQTSLGPFPKLSRAICWWMKREINYSIWR